jgi:DNA-binding FadR family transcriptional regulator
MIVLRTLQEGDSLPSEAELMAYYDVSRPTMREALRVLESERLIKVRRGGRGGAKVQAPRIDVAAKHTGLLLQFRGATLADIYEARLLLEPPLAGMFASRRTEEDLRKMRDLLATEEAAIGRDPGSVAATAARFHQLIVEGAGNETLSVLAGLLQDIVHKHMTAQVLSKAGRPEQEADNRRGYRSHQKLMNFVVAKDSVGAEGFWRSHMENAGEVILREFGPTTVVDLLEDAAGKRTSA